MRWQSAAGGTGEALRLSLSEKGIILSDMTTTRDPRSLAEQIRERFAGAASGQVLTPRDFLDLGSRAAIDQTLTRLCRDGHLRRVGRGLYALPRRHPLFGELSVTSDAVADALAGRDALRLQPAGAYAANQLGLTEQVPMKLLFLTDGPTRVLRLADGREIVLKQTTPRNMQTAGRISGTVIAALRWLGREAVDQDIIGKLRRRLSDQDKAILREDAPRAPAYWLTTALRRIADEAESGSPPSGKGASEVHNSDSTGTDDGLRRTDRETRDTAGREADRGVRFRGLSRRTVCRPASPPTGSGAGSMDGSGVCRNGDAAGYAGHGPGPGQLQRC